MFPNETINPRIMCHFCPQKTISHSGLNRAKFWEMSKNQFTTADSEYSVFFSFSFSQCRNRKNKWKTCNLIFKYCVCRGKAATVCLHSCCFKQKEEEKINECRLSCSPAYTPLYSGSTNKVRGTYEDSFYVEPVLITTAQNSSVRFCGNTTTKSGRAAARS